MAIEKVFTLMKPDSYVKTDCFNKTIEMILRKGLDVYAIQKVIPTELLIQEHYKEVREKLRSKLGQTKGEEVFEDIVDYMMGRFHGTSELLAIVYEGKNAIQIARDLVGKTDPEQADPKSIRGIFGTKEYDIGRHPPLITNVIHCSDSKESVEKEIKLFLRNYQVIGEI